MDKPTIADNKPKKVELVQNEEYMFCTCGKSKNQPFCDWSHAGTSFKPINFIAEETGSAYLCMCKHSSNKPYCDGTHKNFTSDQINKSEEVSNTNEITSTEEEPHLAYIHELAKNGLTKLGHHGEMGAMGVPSRDLPKWEDIQILTAQLAKKPLLDNDKVGTDIIIGKNSKKPLTLNIPIFVSDMSFGALSEEAKIALAKGAEGAGTGICSGEGGMLLEEQKNNSKYGKWQHSVPF